MAALQLLLVVDTVVPLVMVCSNSLVLASQADKQQTPTAAAAPAPAPALYIAHSATVTCNAATVAL
jgi:hypothetical protein